MTSLNQKTTMQKFVLHQLN